MQEYLLLHPAPISVDFKHAPIDEVARVLSQQLGGIPITTLSGESGDFTLKADHQSFWDIMTALNRQEPFNMSGMSTTVGGKATPTLRLMLGGGAATQAWHLEGAVAMATPQISGQPANVNWALRVTMIADPRVKIAQYSQIRVDKITDQDGRSLLHLVMPSSAAMSALARPSFSWTGIVTMASAPGLTRVKELRGPVVVSLVEHEQVTTLDLTKPGAIAGGPGVNVEKNAAGNWVIHLPSPVPARWRGRAPRRRWSRQRSPRGPAVSMRILDKDGTTISTLTASGAVRSTRSPPAMNARGPATVGSHLARQAAQRGSTRGHEGCRCPTGDNRDRACAQGGSVEWTDDPPGSGGRPIERSKLTR